MTSSPEIWIIISICDQNLRFCQTLGGWKRHSLCIKPGTHQRTVSINCRRANYQRAENKAPIKITKSNNEDCSPSNQGSAYNYPFPCEYFLFHPAPPQAWKWFHHCTRTQNTLPGSDERNIVLLSRWPTLRYKTADGHHRRLSRQYYLHTFIGLIWILIKTSINLEAI